MAQQGSAKRHVWMSRKKDPQPGCLFVEYIAKLLLTRSQRSPSCEDPEIYFGLIIVCLSFWCTSQSYRLVQQAQPKKNSISTRQRVHLLTRKIELMISDLFVTIREGESSVITRRAISKHNPEIVPCSAPDRYLIWILPLSPPNLFAGHLITVKAVPRVRLYSSST